MIPAYFVQLENLPLSPNGKLNRKALPYPVRTAEDDYAVPANEIEEKLVGIWAEILKIDDASIGVNTNFFELGGHSLKALELTNIIFKELKIDFPLKEVFKRLTIRSMAAYIESRSWLNAGVEGQQIDSEEVII
jgi:acyl carrier protein